MDERAIFGVSLFRPVGVCVPPGWNSQDSLLIDYDEWNRFSLLERIDGLLSPTILGHLTLLNAGWFGERLVVFFAVELVDGESEIIYKIWEDVLAQLKTGCYAPPAWQELPVSLSPRDLDDDMPGVFMSDDGPLSYEEAQVYLETRAVVNDAIRQVARAVLRREARDIED